MSLLWAFQLLITTILILASFVVRAKSRLKNLPPGSSPLPILGNLLTFSSDPNQPHKVLAMLARTYGPIMTLKLGSVTAIVISSSKLAKEALQKNHYIFSDPFVLDSIRSHQHDQFSVPFLSVSSSRWLFLRKVYSKRLFSDKMLQAMQTQRHEKVVEFINFLRKRIGVVIDVGEETRDATFNIMSYTTFSMDLACGANTKMREMKNLIEIMIYESGAPNIVDYYPFLKVVDPQRKRPRLTMLCDKLFKMFDEIIDTRLKLRKDHPNSFGSCNDLLDVLLDMEEQADNFSRDQTRHLLMDLVGPGIETSSRTMEWAMAELLRKPTVLSKCQEEIDMVIGKGKILQESDISKLPYLQAIVKETLRLHPAAPLLLPRKVAQDTELDGYMIPKGAMVLVNAWAIGRDPKSWVDPDEFNPERFLGSDLDVKGQHMDLIPFGSGKKVCPGISLVLRMVPLMLGMLISSFDWEFEKSNDFLEEDMDMNDKFGITVKKAKPLRALPVRRAT